MGTSLKVNWGARWLPRFFWRSVGLGTLGLAAALGACGPLISKHSLRQAAEPVELDARLLEKLSMKDVGQWSLELTPVEDSRRIRAIVGPRSPDEAGREWLVFEGYGLRIDGRLYLDLKMVRHDLPSEQRANPVLGEILKLLETHHLIVGVENEGETPRLALTPFTWARNPLESGAIEIGEPVEIPDSTERLTLPTTRPQGESQVTLRVLNLEADRLRTFLEENPELFSVHVDKISVKVDKMSVKTKFRQSTPE